MSTSWSWRVGRAAAAARRSLTTLTSTASNQVVRCRFAPSPTGQLHLGGLRTALFNVLMVRSSAPGSSFILRIDDTDRNRYVEGAVESLTATLKWAGLHWDEGPGKDSDCGPFFQSMRLPLYGRYVDRLLASGRAYRDFRPPAVAETGSHGGARLAPYLPPSEAEAQSMISAGRPFVVRLKMPERTIKYDDLVFGHQVLNPQDLGNDPILIKSDGWPTYHLANAVDDIEMRITHVFRGEEWLPSVGKHLALFEAFDAEPPRFAHLPLLINPDGSKLSKRSGDAHVQAYIDRGYEPEALLNFVGLMGYNHLAAGSEADSRPETAEDGTHGEVMSLDTLIRDFDVNRIARSRATPFFPKLDFLNRQHVRRIIGATDSGSQHDVEKRAELLGKAREGLVAAFGERANVSEDKLLQIVQIIGERATTIRDLPAEARFLFEDPDWHSDTALALLSGILKQKNKPKGADLAAVMERIIKTYIEQLDSSSQQDPMPQVVHLVQESTNGEAQTAWRTKVLSTLAKKTLRWAVSGGKPGPAVVDVLPIMGREAMRRRLEAASAALQPSSDKLSGTSQNASS